MRRLSSLDLSEIRIGMNVVHHGHIGKIISIDFSHGRSREVTINIPRENYTIEVLSYNRVELIPYEKWYEVYLEDPQEEVVGILDPIIITDKYPLKEKKKNPLWRLV